jgi:hypothetical protein
MAKFKGLTPKELPEWAVYLIQCMDGQFDGLVCMTSYLRMGTRVQIECYENGENLRGVICLSGEEVEDPIG